MPRGAHRKTGLPLQKPGQPVSVLVPHAVQHDQYREEERVREAAEDRLDNRQPAQGGDHHHNFETVAACTACGRRHY
jgi:hypothetical protein